MKILQTKMLFSCAGFFLWVFKKWGVIYGRNQEEIHGRSAHGSAPDQGKDAIVAAAAVVMGLQTLSSRVNDPQNTFVLTVGMMNGGTQSNIIADEVELVGTTRAFDKAFPNGEGCDTRMPLFLHCQSEYTHMWRKRITTDKAFPAWGR